ncbi:MAG: serine protease [Gammaproteobacteria bacterium]|nr:MAG: serine protease [Gammaproteobacteria bacterium]
MIFKKSLLSRMVTAAILPLAAGAALAHEVDVNRAALSNVAGDEVASKAPSRSGERLYIVQLTGDSGIAHAKDTGELRPENYLAADKGNRYDAKSALATSYATDMKSRQDQVAGKVGATDVLYHYTHTFNGFAAKLTDAQAEALRQDPSVVGVWEDQPYKPDTSNTPTYLGLYSENGPFALGYKGENMVVGVVDTGIWPDNPSVADDGTYSDPATFGWTGTCDTGTDSEFSCSNKLIGARYFDAGFSSVYNIQYALGEFDSPRDADGHGTHTATTAAGNEGVTATRFGSDIGVVSGIAPRARIAAYKVCWNSSYVSPQGNDEAGCFGSDSMAAIDAAVADGVDVINYSIGGSRTSLTAPQTAAMYQAAVAGVFVSVSAGNSGPSPVTVGTPAPWVASVANGTYSGDYYVNALDVLIGDGVSQMAAIEGGITAPLAEVGDVSGPVVIAEPSLACFEGGTAAPLENADAIEGNIALIARGECTFAEKVERAQLAGASAVVVYSDDRPITIMGGDGTFDIPGVMIGNADGVTLTSLIEEGVSVNAHMSAGSFMPVESVGSQVAASSSRGPNGNTGDIIKPDVIAPGTRILAGFTPAPMFGAQGQNYAYLTGTSMSAPHVAGMAALLGDQHPTWSPAQIKSALMTTARQDVVKEDGTTPADPFDIGSGYTRPVEAMNPGFTYNLGAGDYLGFMCGTGEETFVTAESEMSCADVVAAGYSTDPSQLNYPSIAAEDVTNEEVISRTVTDATGEFISYTATIEAPAGFDITVSTFDASGAETEGDTLVVPANGTASYALTINKNADAVIGEWVFGAITWTSEAGYVARSPIALKAATTIEIEVPDSLSLELHRGRASFPVRMRYTGSTSLDYAGLTAPFGATGTVLQDPELPYSFNEEGLGFHAFLVPEGTKVARFSLRDELVSVSGTDIDLYVYRCIEYNCELLQRSWYLGADEDVTLVDPEPANDAELGNFYLVFVHGYNLNGEESVDYTMPVWIVDTAESTTSIRSTTRAVNGRSNIVSITTRNLEPGYLYMGGVTFYNEAGEAQGTTVLEVTP